MDIVWFALGTALAVTALIFVFFRQWDQRGLAVLFTLIASIWIDWRLFASILVVVAYMWKKKN
jgi:hypothetical protein